MPFSSLPNSISYGIVGWLIGGVISAALRLAIRFWPVTLGLIFWVWHSDATSGGPERRAILASFDHKQVFLALDRVISEPWYEVYVVTAVEGTVRNSSIARVHVQGAWCRYRNEDRDVQTIWSDPVSADIEPGASSRLHFEMPRLLKNAKEITCTPDVQVDENDLFRRSGHPEFVRK